MLTLTDYNNIRRFKELNKNHQKVFRYRIRNKFKNVFYGIKEILINYDKLGISPERLISLSELLELVELYKKVIEKEESKAFK